MSPDTRGSLPVAIKSLVGTWDGMTKAAVSMKRIFCGYMLKIHWNIICGGNW